jgi:uncharacterized protein (DUF433 family)
VESGDETMSVRSAESRVVFGDEAGPSWIRRTQNVCGGDACIRNTRIMVWLIEAMRRDGMAEADILDSYPGLTPVDLRTAWVYAAANKAEIDQAIRENEED